MWSKRELRSAGHEQARSRDWSDDIARAAHCSCTWVKQNPWAGVGAGIALGLAVGMLITKK